MVAIHRQFFIWVLQPPVDNCSITDNAVDSHVSSDITINPCVDMYIVGNDLETVTKPFIHPVELQGKRGITSIIGGLFDEGALVNSICSKKFTPLQCTLGAPTPSSKILQMADGGRCCEYTNIFPFFLFYYL